MSQVLGNKIVVDLYRSREAVYKKMRKPIYVGDTLYPSTRDALKALGTDNATLRKHIKSGLPIKGQIVRRG